MRYFLISYFIVTHETDNNWSMGSLELEASDFPSRIMIERKIKELHPNYNIKSIIMQTIDEFKCKRDYLCYIDRIQELN